MKSYVINLPQSEVRRAHVEEQMRIAGLDWDLVPAVDGSRLTPEQRSRLVDEEMVARFPKWLNPGMIGCTLSHQEAYRRIIEEDHAVAFVAEDDIVLPNGVQELLDSIAQHMQGRDVALLYYRSFQPCLFSSLDAVELRDGRRLAYPMEIAQPITTAAYAITSSACKALIEANVPIRVGCDTWGSFYEQGVLDRLRCVVPRPVGVRTDFKSTLGYTGEGWIHRITSSIDRLRVFPFAQLLGLRRRRLESRMSRFEIVAQRSPIAP